MDESLRAQIETYKSHLNSLIQRGRSLRETLAPGAGSTFTLNASSEAGSPPENDHSSKSAIAATRAWQEDCGVTINQLSGGSKAHWLARSFSEAFLMRSAAGQAAEGAAPDEIVQRLIGVLERAIASLSGMDEGRIISASSQAPPAHRFDFVHNVELRPIVEQAYTDSRDALACGHYDLALRTSCGILEAIVTDALEHKGLGVVSFADAPTGKIADWPFETRLAVAESAGLIRGGCARLPAVARAYRDLTDSDGKNHSKAAVSEREARLTGQVLHVVMRDLDPGR